MWRNAMIPLRDIMILCPTRKIPARIGDRPMTATEFENWLDEQPDSWSIDCPACGGVHGVIAEDCFQEGEALLS
jgi:hypothetical protein